MVAAVVVIVVGVSQGEDWLFGVSLPLATLVGLLGVWGALVRRGWTRRDLGFVRASRSLWHLLWEVPLIWITALLLTVLIGTWVGLEPTDAPSSSATGSLSLGASTLLISAMCLTLLVPALEEILFRRVLFGWLESRVGTALAIVGSALAFGLAHLAPPVVLLQFLIGLGAGMLVRGHRTLWASLALHAFNNGIATAVVLAALH